MPKLTPGLARETKNGADHYQGLPARRNWVHIDQPELRALSEKPIKLAVPTADFEQLAFFSRNSCGAWVYGYTGLGTLLQGLRWWEVQWQWWVAGIWQRLGWRLVWGVYRGDAGTRRQYSQREVLAGPVAARLLKTRVLFVAVAQIAGSWHYSSSGFEKERP